MCSRDTLVPDAGEAPLEEVGAVLVFCNNGPGEIVLEMLLEVAVDNGLVLVTVENSMLDPLLTEVEVTEAVEGPEEDVGEEDGDEILEELGLVGEAPFMFVCGRAEADVEVASTATEESGPARPVQSANLFL